MSPSRRGESSRITFPIPRCRRSRSRSFFRSFTHGDSICSRNHDVSGNRFTVSPLMSTLCSSKYLCTGRWIARRCDDPCTMVARNSSERRARCAMHNETQNHRKTHEHTEARDHSTSFAVASLDVVSRRLFLLVRPKFEPRSFGYTRPLLGIARVHSTRRARPNEQ